MSLIERILTDELEGCETTLINDKVCKELETKFYEILNSLDKTEQYELEDIASKLNARVGRICYLQGIIDACGLLVDLKQSPLELISKYGL
jgi:hypothetical protein